jgi:protein disulfide-isomerase A1
MRFSSLLRSLTALALVTLAVAEDPSDVIDVTPSNFGVIAKEPLVLVEFFAPWCGHCKALAPQYEEAATKLKEKGIKLAKVNCVDEADLCQENEVRGYPTLRIFRNGASVDYNGPRQTEGIVSYMIKQSLPAVTEVTGDVHYEFTHADKIVAVLYTGTKTDLPAPQFSATAEKHRDNWLFGHSTDENASNAAGVMPPSLVLYRSFDEPRLVYPYPIASVNVADIEQWISDLSIPYLDQVGPNNYAIYADSGKPLAYLFLDPSEEKKEEHINLVKPIAKKFHNKVNFVWIDAIQFGDHAKALNLHEPKWPAFVIQDLPTQLKYPYSQDDSLDASKIEEMVDSYLAGALKPELKSKPIPVTQDGPVFELVSKQFDEIVFDDSRDVFIEFYASWCGHCKRLKPIWDSLGEHFAAFKDRITIAKMEATENDIPPSAGFGVPGFPTIKFKKAGTRDFIDYNSDRSLENFIAFVYENAKNPLDTPPSGDSTSAQQPLARDEKPHDEL